MDQNSPSFGNSAISSFHPDHPALFLAPMEGVTDFAFRKLITQFQPLDFCVTEFLRVTKNLHPYKVFVRHMPELLTASKTESGTPVLLQLLGGQAEPLALNAARADELGAYGIDLNFGCPAKLVNRHDGGASLLKEPSRIYQIVKKVREAVRPEKSVSAKIRLGYSDTSLLFENALAAQEAGAAWLTVHCRTKEQGYRPPAHWEYIPLLKEKIKIPIIANGDIFDIKDFQKCKSLTNSSAYMLGRGVLRNPQILSEIKNIQCGGQWSDLRQQLNLFFDLSEKQINSNFAAARTKMWLTFLMQQNPEAKDLFHKIKIYRGDEFRHQLKEGLNHGPN